MAHRDNCFNVAGRRTEGVEKKSFAVAFFNYTTGVNDSLMVK